MQETKVLYVAQEITPYLPETEISVIGRNLPQAIQDRGREIRTFMPRYGCINERRNQLHEVIRLSGMNIIINENDHPLIIKVASIQAARMQVYFIDNDDFFHRKFTLADEAGNSFDDNDERAIFFARGVIETVRKLQWAPDIIHCQGWFTNLIGLYAKKVYFDDPLFQDTRVVLSLYNDDYNKPLDKAFKKKLVSEGIHASDLEHLNEPTYKNYQKMCVDFADGAIFGSKTINPEVEQYVKDSGKHYLPFQEIPQLFDAYAGFYDKILTATVND